MSSSHRRLALRAAVLSAIPFLQILIGQPASAQTTLSASFECFDGKPSDIAAQSDVDPQDPTKRAWIAQGRVRAAVRLSDRARMHDEDRTLAVPNQVDPTGPDLIIAVEVNEDRVDGRSTSTR